MEDLISKIKSSTTLSPKAEEYVVSIAKEKAVSKGDVLIRQGQAVKNTYFVKDGCIRAYCIDKRGKSTHYSLLSKIGGLVILWRSTAMNYLH